MLWRIQTVLILAASGLLLNAISFHASGQEAGPSGDKQTYRVQVDMVSLPVVVTDPEGSHPRDLKREDFTVFENGIRQEIAGFAAVEEPISVALLLDVSGSTEFQLSRIQDEAIRFVDILRDGDSVAILSVADQVKVLEHFSIYHERNPEKIRHIRAGGLSAVYEGVAFALDKVLRLEFGRKALVLFSDGVDNRSESATEESTLELARQTESPIYCVYFRTDQDRWDPGRFDPGSGRWPVPRRRPKDPASTAGREYMEKLSKLSGGMLVDASRVENLGSAFRRIATELSSQYSIGYYPKDSGYDKKFRQIEVKTIRPGLVIRTRQGYYHIQ